MALYVAAIFVTHSNQYDLIFGPGGFVCATRGDVAMPSWPLLLPTFALSLSLFSPSFAFDPLGETPVAENLFPPIFWHN